MNTQINYETEKKHVVAELNNTYAPKKIAFYNHNLSVDEFIDIMFLLKDNGYVLNQTVGRTTIFLKEVI